MKYQSQRLLRDVVLLTPEIHEDNRGCFFEFFQEEDYNDIPGIPSNFVQDNVAFSHKNVLRGLHYQIPPYRQGKLITCLKGRIWDIAVDIQPESGYFKKWVFINLTDENHQIVYIPPGFAHGYYTFTDAVVLYKCTSFYSPKHERGICWNDPDLNIAWKHANPIISSKDNKLPRLQEVLHDLGNW